MMLVGSHGTSWRRKDRRKEERNEGREKGSVSIIFSKTFFFVFNPNVVVADFCSSQYAALYKI